MIKQEFLVYGFLGWLLENCYNKHVEGKFWKANFLHGPIKPMYGIGGVLLVYSHRHYRKQFGYAAIIIPLLVEWCSGRWLDERYHLKYWDYNGERIQLGGYICLRFALCWIVLAQVVVYLVQPLLERCMKAMARLSGWQTICQSLFRGFVLDSMVTLYRREKQLTYQ